MLVVFLVNTQIKKHVDKAHKAAKSSSRGSMNTFKTTGSHNARSTSPAFTASVNVYWLDCRSNGSTLIIERAVCHCHDYGARFTSRNQTHAIMISTCTVPAFR